MVYTFKQYCFLSFEVSFIYVDGSEFMAEYLMELEVSRKLILLLISQEACKQQIMGIIFQLVCDSFGCTGNLVKLLFDLVH